jgi:hypothetical protein
MFEFELLLQYKDYVEKRQGCKLVLFGAGLRACELLRKYLSLDKYDSPWVNGFNPFNAFKLINDNVGQIKKVCKMLADARSVHVYDAMIEKMYFWFFDYRM